MNDRMAGPGARWLALYALCLGDLMIVLDMNIVNVALPSIQADLGFSQTALAWVVNAYMLTFGGFLLLGGPAGRPLRQQAGASWAASSSFTLASVACGLAPSAVFLVVGRAVQGLGGAAVSAVALALIMGLFSEPGRAGEGDGRLRVRDVRRRRPRRAARRRTHRLVQLALDLPRQRPDRRRGLAARTPGAPRRTRSPSQRGRLDVPGAGLVTPALMLAVYGVVGGNEAGWTSARDPRPPGRRVPC